MEVSDRIRATEVIDVLAPVSGRVWGCLQAAGIETAGDLLDRSGEDLLALPGFGKGSLREVKESLARFALALKGDEMSLLDRYDVSRLLRLAESIEDDAAHLLEEPEQTLQALCDVGLLTKRTITVYLCTDKGHDLQEEERDRRRLIPQYRHEPRRLA